MRKYNKRTPGRTLIPEENIEKAKELIKKGKSKRYAADFVGINEATLRKRLKKGSVPTSLGRFKPTFTKDQEAEFAIHCKDMDERFFGVTIADLRRLAYEFAVANKIEHPFNDSCRMAGRDWVAGFLQRNSHLGLRQSAPISLARAIGFNKVQVERFYKNLKDIYEKYKFRPHRIYNMDETGISTVPKKTPKVIASKGKKVVGKIVSAERGITITVVMCMSATGYFIPPAFIYPRKRPKAELLDNGPSGSVCMVSDSGFINTNLFVNWLHHFKDFAHPTQDDPVLLILDNHSTHISLEAATYAKEQHIIMVTIPPHGSHKLQPLDVAVHSPLKTKYAIECEKWMNRHPGRGITQFQIAGLFNVAFQYVATIRNAEAGFKATGIYPYADDLFDETDFAPSTVTDQYPSNNTNTYIDPSILNEFDEDIVEDHSQQNEARDCSQSPEKEFPNTEAEHNIIQASEKVGKQFPNSIDHDRNNIDQDVTYIEEEIHISKVTQENGEPVADVQQVDDLKPTTSENAQKVTVAELSPLPRMIEKKKKTRISLKSEIITSTPFKKLLEDKKKMDDKKINKQYKKKIDFDEPSSSKKKKPKLKLVGPEPKPGPSGLKTRKLKPVTKKQMKIEKTNKEFVCPICGEVYKDPPDEEWIECLVCKRWYHEDCTAYEKIGIFLCDFCDE